MLIHRKLAKAAGMAALVWLATFPARAADISWTNVNAGTYFYNAPNSWNSAASPSNQDNAFLTNYIGGASITITNGSGPITNANLTLFNTGGAGNYVLAITNNFDYRVTNTTVIGTNAMVRIAGTSNGTSCTFSNNNLFLTGNGAIVFGGSTAFNNLIVAGAFSNSVGTAITNDNGGGVRIRFTDPNRVVTNNGTMRFRTTNTGAILQVGTVAQAGTFYNRGLIELSMGGNADATFTFSNYFINAGTFILTNRSASNGANLLTVTGVPAGAALTNEATGTIQLIGNGGGTSPFHNVLTLTSGGFVNLGTLLGNAGANKTGLVALAANQVFSNALGGQISVAGAGALEIQSDRAVNAGTNTINGGVLVYQRTDLSPGVLENAGVIGLSNGTLSVSALTNLTNARIAGSGTVTGTALVNLAGGSVLASNGTLNILGFASGAGTFSAVTNPVAGLGGTLNFAGGGQLDLSTQSFYTNSTLIAGGNFTNTQAGSVYDNFGTLVVGGTFYHPNHTDLILGSALNTTGGLTVAGNLWITNAASPAKLVVGQAGFGVLTLNAGGNLVVNQLFVTNNTVGGATNSIFGFAGGTLTTSNAANQLAAYVLLSTNANNGAGANSYTMNGTWNMLGGTNILGFVGTAGTLTYGGGVTNVVGPGAVLVLSNVNNFTVGRNVGGASGNNALLIGGVGASAVVTGNIINVGTQSSSFNLLRITNGTLLANALTLNSQTSANGNSLIISKNGTLDLNLGSFFAGHSPNGSAANATVDGGVATNIGTVFMGSQQGSLTISNGGGFFSGNIVIGGNNLPGNDQNYNAGGLGALSTVSNGTIGVGISTSLGQNAGNRNTMTITNATLWSGATTIGDVLAGGTANGASNNTVNVRASGLWNLLGNSISVGIGSATRPSSNNQLYVDSGIISNVATLVVGSGANSVGNNAIITNGGQVYANTARVGSAATSERNSVLITAGGLLQANTLTNFTGGTGNTISNVAGIYQFTTNTPVIKNNGIGNIALTDGTISFRAITNADVTSSLGSGALSGIAFAGANTFMLNSASNSLSGQAYIFQTVAGSPSNYVNLIMVSGQTAYRGGDLTIGATGSMLVSNTTATIANQLVATGTVRLVNSTLQLPGGLTGTGVLTNAAVANSTVIFSGGNTTFAGTLRGAGLAVTISSGTQTLTGNQSYEGATTLNGGTIALANSSGTALSLSTIAVSGGNLVVNNSGGTGISTNFAITSGALIVSNTASTGINANLAVNGGTVRVANTGGTGIGAGNTVTIGSTGFVLVTNSASTGIGANVTVNNGGSLSVNNTGGSGIGAGSVVTVNSLGKLAGGGTIAGSVTIANGGSLAPGNSVGTLNIATLSLASGSRLDYEFSGGVNDLVNVTTSGGLTLNGGIFKLLQGDGVTTFDSAGLYNLIGYSGAIAGSGIGALSVGNAVNNRTYSFGTAGGYVTLAIGGTGVGWNPGSLSTDAYWSDPQNWNAGNAPTPPSAFDQLVFDGNTKTENTNDFASGTAFSGFVFTNSAGTFVLNGLSAGTNSVNLVGDIVNYSANTQTINLPLVLQGGSRSFIATGGALVVNGVISGVDSTLGLIKQGSALVTLTGANTYSGITEIVNGALRATSGVGLPAASNLKLSGGVLESSGTFSRSLGTAGGSVQWAGTGGFSANGSTLSVNLGGSGASVTWGSGSFVPAGSALLFSSSSADSTVKFINPIDLGGAMRTVQVVNGTAIIDADLLGAVTGSGGFTKTGTGTLRLSRNHTYSGSLVVDAGTLIANAVISPGSPLTLASSTWLGGTGTIARVISGSGTVTPGNSPGILTVNQVDPSGEMNFDFEFTNIGSPNYSNPGASLNDVLRITNTTPFTVALGLTNTVNLYINTSLVAGVTNVFRGGFFTDLGTPFDSSITGASYNVIGAGSLVFVTTTNATAFGHNGYVMEFGLLGPTAVVPEPQVLMFWLCGAFVLISTRRRHRNPPSSIRTDA